MKKAFTLLELVFVIVIIGIISSTVLSRTDNTRLQEAAVQLVSHIRYTQHLAMIDDRYDTTNPNWFIGRWKIDFSEFNFGGDVAYIISKDSDGVFQGHATIATDPLSRLPMDGRRANGDNEALNLENKYGITTLAYGANGEEIIVFDHLGRPYAHFIGAGPTNPHNDLLNNNYDLRLTSSEGNITIRIAPETGYVCVLDGNNNCR